MNNKFKLAMMTAAPMAMMMLANTAHADEQYTVQSGDTLYKISQKFDVDMNKIASQNKIADINRIYVGQTLTIPTQTSGSTYTGVKQVNTQQTTSAQQSAPVQQTTSNNTKQQAVSVQSAPAQSYNSSSSSEEAAKAWIANRESGGSYSARNGQYIGKYQLSASYLNGDYSPANQERVANNYVQSRYGSWAAAQSFWQANGWY